MLIPKRGDMYVADLGQGIGSEQANERPVVIIQNNKGNHYADTTIQGQSLCRYDNNCSYHFSDESSATQSCDNTLRYSH